MDSSSQNTHDDISSTFDDEEIPIPTNLRFTVDSLKLLATTPLTPENHLIWFSNVESILLANGYSKYLDPQTPTPPPFLQSQEGHRTKNPRYPTYNLLNQTLMTALKITISPSLQPLALGHTNLAALWTTLKSYLQSQTRSRLIQLKAELNSLSMRGSDLSQYLTRVKTIYDQLASTGCHIDDEDMIIYTMNGLPTQFDGFCSAYRLRNDPITLYTFFSLLNTEAINIHRRHQQTLQPDPNLTLHTTYTQPQSTPYRNPNYKGKNPRPYYPKSSTSQPPHTSHNPNRPTPTTCQLCKKLGHSATTCRYRYHPSSPSSSSSTKPKAAYISDHTLPTEPTTQPPPYTPPSTSPDDWYLDSGASAHLTNQFKNLHIPQPYTGPASITVGNGDQLPITHTGQHTINTPHGQDHPPPPSPWTYN